MCVGENNDAAMGAAEHMFGIEWKSMARQLARFRDAPIRRERASRTEIMADLQRGERERESPLSFPRSIASSFDSLALREGLGWRERARKRETSLARGVYDTREISVKAFM